MRYNSSTCLAVLLLVARVGSAAESNTGPWDMPGILSASTPLLVDKRIEKPHCELLAVRYLSEPYKGQDSHVFAYLAIPRPSNGKHPAMLLVHGGGGKAFAEWAEQWAARGYVALAMDLSGNGADSRPLEDGGPSQDDGSKFRPVAKEDLKNTWPYQAVAAVLRGHNCLANNPPVDPDRIGITGISWGGYLTCIVAGIDDRLKVAVPVYGCGFLSENSAWEDNGIFAKMSQEARDQWISNFDPAQYLPGVRCPILFVNGTNDFAYPLDSYQKSYRLVTSPTTLSVTVNMPHSHPDGWAPKEIAAFVDHVLQGGPPLATLSAITLSDSTASATYQGATVISAALHYTTDSGPWQQRQWSTLPARVESSSQVIRADMPTRRPVVCFLTAVDDRELTVSTPHIELGN